MIGRGAIRNPWIFSQLRDSFEGKPTHTVIHSDLLEYINLLYDGIANQHNTFDEAKHIQHMKKYLVYIVQGLNPEFEHDIRRVRTATDFHEVCRRFLDHNSPVPILPLNNSKLFCGFDALRS
jgi:tRNA-dihydrouridine synthase C